MRITLELTPMTDPTTHTPGPWVWRWKSGSLHQVGTERPYGATVLSPRHDYDSGTCIEVSDADATLIEAAPELLAALEGVMRVADRATVEFDAARAAIAKAKGTSNDQP